MIDLDKSLDELGIDDIPPGLTSIEKQATVRDLLMSRSGVYREAAAVVVVPELILAIGDIYGGGKVAYIFEDGDTGYVSGEQHGLIAATEDQSTGITWAILSYQETAVTGTLLTIGTGSANTDKIIDQNGVGITYAAGLARAYSGGGYNDWFLPSKDELNKLYLNRGAIGGFDENLVTFWSSSESDVSSAWSQNLSSGSSFDYYPKSYSGLRVRAVRAF